MCSVYCFQRILAGNMAPHADAITALLTDEEPFVRSSAATALGCLGRCASRYQRSLLALLKDMNGFVRYASLITLGGMLAKALPYSSAIAEHLTDSNFRCRMAALRALKCMGKTAAPYIARLQMWQQQWRGRTREPITMRALIFPNTALRDIFRGSGPLGKKLAGPKTRREVMLQQFKARRKAMEAREDDYIEQLEEPLLSMAPSDKEWREDHLSLQRRYHARDWQAHVQARSQRVRLRSEWRSARKDDDFRRFRPPCGRRRSRRMVAIMDVAVADDFVIPL
jgi:hypothetical protein